MLLSWASNSQAPEARGWDRGLSIDLDSLGGGLGAGGRERTGVIIGAEIVNLVK